MLKRNEEAAEHLARAIELEDNLLPARHPKRPHRRNNRAIALMLADQLSEAIRLNAEAWELKVHHSEDGHDVTSGRILVTRIALSWLAGWDASTYLGQIRVLLEQPALPCHGDIDRHWQAEDILDYWRQQLSPIQADLLAVLHDIINNKEKMLEIDRFPAWTGQTAVPLDASWPDLCSERA